MARWCIVADTLPIIGSYVHGLFDSPDILRRLLNITAETHNLPEPRVTEFSIADNFDDDSCEASKKPSR
jgi:cobyric acid synthase